MTRIDFYRYAENKLQFACRVASRAFEKSSRLIVYTPDERRLQEFDKLLWSFNATRFIPHCMLGAAVEAETPIVLATSGEKLPHHDVLLNLSDEWPPFFATFERLLEIVSTDEADKERARGRWTFYKQRGYDLSVHEVEA